MNTNELYESAFAECFKVSCEEARTLKYKSIPAWDSVGQMNLILKIEDLFDIALDPDDIIDFMSFDAGKRILSSKYNISF